MKRSASLGFGAAFLVLVAALSFPAAFAATNRIGGPCKVVNQKVRIGSVTATCTKVGSKLLWTKAATPKATETPSAKKATTTPSPASPKPTAATALASQTAYAINVSAGSWFFNFSYLVDGVKGALKSDAASSKVLYLPEGKLVQLTLTNSSDVSHGFWIPTLLVDKEILPGNKASVEFTPDKIGKYAGSCHISCGRGHSTMTFTVEVISEADYLKYLAGLKA